MMGDGPISHSFGQCSTGFTRHSAKTQMNGGLSICGCSKCIIEYWLSHSHSRSQSNFCIYPHGCSWCDVLPQSEPSTEYGLLDLWSMIFQLNPKTVAITEYVCMLVTAKHTHIHT